MRIPLLAALVAFASLGSAPMVAADECIPAVPWPSCVDIHFDVDTIGPFAYTSTVGTKLYGVRLTTPPPFPTVVAEVVAELDSWTGQWVYDYQGVSGTSLAFTVYGTPLPWPPAVVQPNDASPDPVKTRRR